MTASAMSATTDTATMSATLTPSTLPNNTASMLFDAWPYRFMSAKPSAKDAVVTTPIAASAPNTRRRATRAINTPETIPQMPAPMKKLMPITALAAAPPNTA